ncbi:MAG: DsbA family protein [Myxococcales bacterium]
MISFGNKRWLVSLGATVAIALVGASLSSACKPKGSNKPAAAAASGSSSAKPAGPELTSQCQEYVDRLCEKVGKQSSTCTDMTKAAELLSPAACTAAKRDIKYTADKLAEKRKSCDTLVTRLCGELGKTTETCKMVETHTKNFPPERCKMMLERYPEVLADLKRMEDQNKPLSPDKQAAIAKNDAPSFGPQDAKVTIVEFSDFQCPFCSRGANAVTDIKKKYAGKVRVVFRQFPLSFHDKAHLAAEAALAAHAQGKFWEFHDKMFANQSALDRASLEKFAGELGLKVDAFKKALDDKTYAAQVDADMKMGTDVGVQGTPSMFINGKKVQNATDSEAIGKTIDELLKG